MKFYIDQQNKSSASAPKRAVTTINKQAVAIVKERIKDIGEYNSWKGIVAFYFTTKELRALKKLGITKDDTIKTAYQKLITK